MMLSHDLFGVVLQSKARLDAAMIRFVECKEAGAIVRAAEAWGEATAAAASIAAMGGILTMAFSTEDAEQLVR